MRIPLTLTLNAETLVETTASAAFEEDEEGVPRLVGLSVETDTLIAEWTAPVAAFLPLAARRAIADGSVLTLTAGIGASWPLVTERLTDGRRVVFIEEDHGERVDLSALPLRDLLTDEQIDALEASVGQTG